MSRLWGKSNSNLQVSSRRRQDLRAATALKTVWAQLAEPAAGIRARRAAAVRESQWGKLPQLTFVSAVGIFTMAAAATASRFEIPSASLLYWLSLLILFVPVTFRLLSSSISRHESIGLVVLMGMALFVVVMIINRPGLVNFDEMLHWRTANDMLQSEHLFTENTMLPASPYYPGLEILTTMLVKLTGMPVATVAIIILGTSRLLLVLALYLIYERISGSIQVAGLATVLFMTNANFLYFSPQYAYEGLAMPLALLGLFALLLRNAWVDLRKGLLGISLLLVSATIPTHHLTMYLLSAFLLLWSLVDLGYRALEKLDRRWGLTSRLGRQPLFKGVVAWLCHAPQERTAREPEVVQAQRNKPIPLVAAFALAGSALYVVFIATPVINYLYGAISPGIHKLLLMVTGELKSRPLFQNGVGYEAPEWEQYCSLTATSLVVLGLGLGLPYLWRELRKDPIAVTWAAASICFPFSLLLRLNSGTWEISARLGAFLMIGVAFVLAVGLVRFRPASFSGRMRTAVAGSLITLVFAGGVISGSSPWARLPGPYLASADPRSIEPEGITTAEWAKEYLGQNNRFAADRINAILMDSYGMQEMVFREEREGQDIVYAFFTPRFDTQTERIIQDGRLQYLVIDRRLTVMRPMLGFYFQSDEPRSAPPGYTFSVLAQNKFDTAVQINRIFDNGDIIIYDTAGLADAH